MTAEGASNAALRARAVELLRANWNGRSTRASRTLYPHQWSWDSACVARALSHGEQERAEGELTSLFAGQWANGMLPHIRFAPGPMPYFPGPEIWGTASLPEAPITPLTSGIVQPPIHASALRHLLERGEDQERACAFAARLYPAVLAWHRYLHEERSRPGSELVEIWHPWESGMDNSPLWDAALERVPPARATAGYRRTDLEVAGAEERPTDWQYDRYLSLVEVLREVGYEPARSRAATPFAVRDVLFNVLLAEADRDLVAIAALVGADPRPVLAWAAGLEEAIHAEMWAPAAGSYENVDVLTGERVEVATLAGTTPLLLAGLPGDRAERLLATLGRFQVRPGGELLALASVPPGSPSFDPVRYWRGPVWPMLTLVLAEGLRRRGQGELALRLEAGLLGLIRRSGFWEHFHPETGQGQGGADMSWTAAIAVEMLDHEAVPA